MSATPALDLLSGNAELPLLPPEILDAIAQPVFELLTTCDEATYIATDRDKKAVREKFIGVCTLELIGKVREGAEDKQDAALELAERIPNRQKIVEIVLSRLDGPVMDDLKAWAKRSYMDGQWHHLVANSVCSAYQDVSPQRWEDLSLVLESKLAEDWAMALPIFQYRQGIVEPWPRNTLHLKEMDSVLHDALQMPENQSSNEGVRWRALGDAIDGLTEGSIADAVRNHLRTWDGKDCRRDVESLMEQAFPPDFGYPELENQEQDDLYQVRRVLTTCVSLIRHFHGPWSKEWASAKATELRGSVPSVAAVCLWAFDSSGGPFAARSEAKPFFVFRGKPPTLALTSGVLPVLARPPPLKHLLRCRDFAQRWLVAYRLTAMECCNEAAQLLLDAYAQDDERARVVFIATAMEALVKIKAKEGEPVGMTLRESIPHWFPVAERERLRDDIQAFYSHRSSVVHGESKTNSKSAGDEDGKNSKPDNKSSGHVTEGGDRTELTIRITRAIARCIVEMVAWCLKQPEERRRDPDALDQETRARRLGVCKPARLVFAARSASRGFGMENGVAPSGEAAAAAR